MKYAKCDSLLALFKLRIRTRHIFTKTILNTFFFKLKNWNINHNFHYFELKKFVFKNNNSGK